jgi:hypothetical protein
MFISGFIISLNFVQVLPEVMSETQIKYKIIEGATMLDKGKLTTQFSYLQEYAKH